MCEKRTRKIKRGSLITRLREARRVQRLQMLAVQEAAAAPQFPLLADRIAKTRVMLELAWKTALLIQKNKIIQQKIIALKQETHEFVASVTNCPEDQRLYLQQFRLFRTTDAYEDPAGENMDVSHIKQEPMM